MPLTTSNSPFQTFILPSLPFRRRSSTATAASSLPALSHSPSSPVSLASPVSTTFASSPPASQASDPPNFLQGATSTISCSRCHAELALTSQIISKGFTGRHGRAYLVSGPRRNGHSTAHRDDSSDSDSSGDEEFAYLPNTYSHRPVNRSLVTGVHRVADVACSICHNVMGWRYINAEEDSQKYKIGKYILETKRTTIGHWWEGSWKPVATSPLPSARRASVDMFDDMSIDMASEEAPDEPATVHNPEQDADELDEMFGGDYSGLGIPSGDDLDDIQFDSQDEDECEALFAGVWNPAFARRSRARKALGQ